MAAKTIKGFTFSRDRIIQVAVIVVLAILGSALHYLTMPYINFRVELFTQKSALFGSAAFARALDPLWLPGYEPGPVGQATQAAINMFSVGPALHQIGVVVAVLMCFSLFQDEINKFFWWPLHLSGWILALASVPLLIGTYLFHQADVAVSLGPAWVVLSLTGVVILVLTFRAHKRIDSYASI